MKPTQEQIDAILKKLCDEGDGDTNSSEIMNALKVGAGFATLILVLKESPEVKVMKQLVPAIGEELKPWIKAVSDFFTELDIEAVKKMEAAGISQVNAVALQRTSIVYALAPGILKGLAGVNTAKKN